ncbi:MAG: hypothetical protein GY820_33230, partial [Gammaproteobacteria bacterium]|nr:hypothetical protein [Gammaproteobacteria bacterium]
MSRRYANAEESESAQSNLIQCDAVVCRTQSGALFWLCSANWNLDEIVTRSKARQKQIETISQKSEETSPSFARKRELTPLLLDELISIPKELPVRKDVREHQLDTWVSPKNSEMQLSQEKDDELSPIIELLKNSPKHVLEEKLLGYYLDEGVLYFSDGMEKGKLVVPKEYRQLVCCEHHSLPTGGHFGSKKTLAAIR